MNRRFVISLALLALLAGFGLTHLHGQAAGAKPTAIAVVKVQSVLNALAEKSAVEARITALTETSQKEALARQEEIKKLQTDLKVALQPGTPAYEKTREDLEFKTIEFQSWQRFVQGKIEREKAIGIEELYHKMNDAISRIAKKNSYGIVLYVDESERIQGQNQQQLAGAIQLRKVLYADPALDLTDLVTQLLNNEFNNRK